MSLIAQANLSIAPDNMIVGLIYSGNISAVQLEDMILKLRYDFRLPTRAIYSYTTIDTPGFYQLADNVVNNTITISSDNVTLDMNGCTVSGATNGIAITSGRSNVTIKNGIVSGTTSDGVTVGAGCSNIVLDSITVLNVTTARGIFFNQVTNGMISNCDVVSSNTGLELSICHNVTLENCLALANSKAGFSLITSTTCQVMDCKAISTGQGSTDQFANIYGFACSSGNGNIFQRCIANSTQGLTITGGQSVIAGFALLGTGTQCNSIIDCVAANSTSSPNGVTTPYGIWLQNTLSSVLTLTAVPPVPTPGSVIAVDWSPDGQYIAVGDNSSPFLRIYSYDRIAQTLDQVATPTLIPSTMATVAWSPDAGFLATALSAGANTIRLYQFNRLNNTLTQLGNPLPNTSVGANGSGGIAWSPDGLYFAVAILASPSLFLYSFDEVNGTATRVQTVTFGTSAYSVAFSHDGNYIALGTDTTPFVRIYQLNRTSNILTLFASASPAAALAFSVRFSPDDNYLAVGTNTAGTGLAIYAFSKTAATLTRVNNTATDGAVEALDWSSDGRFLVVATDPTIRTYQFDRGLNTLTQVASATNFSGGLFLSVRFSPDGKYIVSGNSHTTPNFKLVIHQAMNFPSGNVIMNNRVYCDAGNRLNGGIGISGSSIENMIIGNVAYNNPQNYAFCCNVFNQLFGDGPTGLQNIEGDINVPIDTPLDLPLNLQRIQLLAQSLVDNLI